MKIAFSSLACPTWDLATIVTQAKALGYDGIELRGLGGELHLPLVPELAGQPGQVRQLLAEKGIELICLGSSATLDSRDPREVARQKGVITEFVELAARLSCPAVRIFAGEVQGFRDTGRLALARIAEAARSLIPVLVRHNVRLLIENGGDFPGSADLWFLIDAVAHPAVQCCWNQTHARLIGERPTTSIPRLGNKLGLVHVTDAEFDPEGVLLRYLPPGEGQAEVAREVELLRGIAYQGYISVEWPRLWVSGLAAAEAVLPAAAQFLRAKVQEQQPVLSAYKGDKNAPRYPRARTAPIAPPAAH